MNSRKILSRLNYFLLLLLLLQLRPLHNPPSALGSAIIKQFE